MVKAYRPALPAAVQRGPSFRLADHAAAAAAIKPAWLGHPESELILVCRELEGWLRSIADKPRACQVLRGRRRAAGGGGRLTFSGGFVVSGSKSVSKSSTSSAAAERRA